MINDEHYCYHGNKVSVRCNAFQRIFDQTDKRLHFETNLFMNIDEEVPCFQKIMLIWRFLEVIFCQKCNKFCNRPRTDITKWLKWCKVRSSRPEALCKKVVLKNFWKFTGKHLWQSLFLIKFQAEGVFLWTFRNF